MITLAKEMKKGKRKEKRNKKESKGEEVQDETGINKPRKRRGSHRVSNAHQGRQSALTRTELRDVMRCDAISRWRRRERMKGGEKRSGSGGNNNREQKQ